MSSKQATGRTHPNLHGKLPQNWHKHTSGSDQAQIHQLFAAVGSPLLQLSELQLCPFSTPAAHLHVQSSGLKVHQVTSYALCLQLFCFGLALLSELTVRQLPGTKHCHHGQKGMRRRGWCKALALFSAQPTSFIMDMFPEKSVCLTLSKSLISTTLTQTAYVKVISRAYPYALLKVKTPC